MTTSNGPADDDARRRDDERADSQTNDERPVSDEGDASSSTAPDEEHGKPPRFRWSVAQTIRTFRAYPEALVLFWLSGVCYAVVALLIEGVVADWPRAIATGAVAGFAGIVLFGSGLQYVRTVDEGPLSLGRVLLRGAVRGPVWGLCYLVIGGVNALAVVSLAIPLLGFVVGFVAAAIALVLSMVAITVAVRPPGGYQRGGFSTLWQRGKGRVFAVHCCQAVSVVPIVLLTVVAPSWAWGLVFVLTIVVTGVWQSTLGHLALDAVRRANETAPSS